MSYSKVQGVTNESSAWWSKLCRIKLVTREKALSLTNWAVKIEMWIVRRKKENLIFHSQRESRQPNQTRSRVNKKIIFLEIRIASHSS